MPSFFEWNNALDDAFHDLKIVTYYILAVRKAITNCEQMPQSKVNNGLDLWGRYAFVQKVRKK